MSKRITLKKTVAVFSENNNNNHDRFIVIYIACYYNISMHKIKTYLCVALVNKSFVIFEISFVRSF